MLLRKLWHHTAEHIILQMNMHPRRGCKRENMRETQRADLKAAEMMTRATLIVLRTTINKDTS